MADEQFGKSKSRDELMKTVFAMQDQLAGHGIPREFYKLNFMQDEEIEELIEALEQQLAERKKILGVR